MCVFFFHAPGIVLLAHDLLNTNVIEYYIWSKHSYSSRDDIPSESTNLFGHFFRKYSRTLYDCISFIDKISSYEPYNILSGLQILLFPFVITLLILWLRTEAPWCRTLNYHYFLKRSYIIHCSFFLFECNWKENWDFSSLRLLVLRNYTGSCFFFRIIPLNCWETFCNVNVQTWLAF